MAFAFVVLLGTVFPLLYQALTNNQVTVAAPYFDTMAIPVGLALLFLMGVAPALPWRKTTAAVMRHRLVVPAVIAVVTVVACVIGGVHGVEPLIAFGLGAFAAASAGRALVLSIGGAWRSARTAGASTTRAVLAGWRGLVGRANGGMVVHIGVVVFAVGLAAASSFGRSGEIHLVRGQSATFDGHSVEFLGYRTVASSAATADEAIVRVDGGAVLYPAITQFGPGSNTDPVGTPSIDSSWRDDVYLTIDSIPSTSAVALGVVVKPMVTWLWAGGILIAVGTVLSAVPGRRRRPTDPVSAPVDGTVALPGAGDDLDGTEQATGAPETESPAGPHQVPVGSGDRL